MLGAAAQAALNNDLRLLVLCILLSFVLCLTLVRYQHIMKPVGHDPTQSQGWSSSAWRCCHGSCHLFCSCLCLCSLPVCSLRSPHTSRPPRDPRPQEVEATNPAEAVQDLSREVYSCACPHSTQRTGSQKQLHTLHSLQTGTCCNSRSVHVPGSRAPNTHDDCTSQAAAPRHNRPQ